jgi:hypothetical protein
METSALQEATVKKGVILRHYVFRELFHPIPETRIPVLASAALLVATVLLMALQLSPAYVQAECTARKDR